MSTRPSALPAAALSALLLLAGCHVHTSDSGDQKHVDIGTPFGSLKVNTDNSSDTAALGLTAYPGAVPVKTQTDHNANSADVNLSFGDFHLGIKAATFQTPDAPAKVLAFYRADLNRRYGDSIQCQGQTTLGSPARTAQGLTCADSHGTHTTTVTTTESSGNGVTISHGTITTQIELRSGSPLHQHIVGVDARDGGTRLSLIALDLPSHLTQHSDKAPE